MFYQVGETARLQASILDSNDEPANPTTLKITINKPDRSKVVSAADMTNDETGEYYYDYLCSADLGEYDYKVVAVGGGGRVTIVKDSFHVDASI